MSGGSNKGTSTTVTEIPAWLRDEYQQNIARAEGIANQGFTPYGGQLSAGDNQWLSAARDQAVGATYSGRGELDNASNVYSQIANQSPFYFDAAQAGGVQAINPTNAQAATFGGTRVDPSQVSQVQAGSIPGGDLSAYTNPYQSSVIDQSNAALDRQRQMVQTQNAAAATAAGAFGGSRHGIVDAENNKNFAELQRQNTNNLLNAGFDRATGLMSADTDRALQAALANQGVNTSVLNANADRGQQAGLASMGAQNDANLFNAGAANTAAQYNSSADYAARAADADRRQQAAIANAGIDQANTAANLQGAAGLAGIAGQRTDQALNSASALGQLGQQYQGNQQAGLDAAYQEFLRGQQDPLTRQTLLNQSVLGISNAGGSTSSNANSKAKSF